MDNLLRSLVRRAMRFYYPHIQIEGRDRLPATGATLFVANHPNSIMDAPLIGFVVQRPVHFFAKAPLFDLPLLGAVMRAMGMMPAYRGMDDKSQVKRNLQTLETGAAVLRRGEPVGIFPEGKSHDREGVEQVRSGASRMVWQAANDGVPVTVVPIGLNYERKERFRSAVWVRVGEHLDAEVWFRDRRQDEKRAIRSMTEEIDRRLRNLVVHLNEPAWEPLLSELEVLVPDEEGDAGNPVAAIEHRKRLADAMNYFLATDRPGSEVMAATIERHHQNVVNAGLTLDSPILQSGASRLAWKLIKRTLWLLAGLLPALAGTAHHLPPFVLTRGLVALISRRGRTTIAQSRLVFGLPIYAAWYVVVWWSLSAWVTFRIATLWIILAPVAGVVALHYWGRLYRTGRDWQHELKMLTRPSELRRLRTERVELHHKLLRLRAEYLAK